MAPPTSNIDRTTVIGISGSPFCGKTTLANNLIEALSLAYNVDVYLLSQSDYTCAVEKGPQYDPFLFNPADRDEQKWRNGADPKCVKSDFWNIVKDMTEKGKNYSKCKLVKQGFKGMTKIHFDRIVIVEGHLLFHGDSPVKDLFDVKIFLKINSADESWARKPTGGPTPMPWQYWNLKPYFEKLAWPQYRRSHRALLSGTTGGVDVLEVKGRGASQVQSWGKQLVAKVIAEQQMMWGTA